MERWWRGRHENRAGWGWFIAALTVISLMLVPSFGVRADYAEQATVTGSTPAISADGSTLITGTSDYAAYIFVKSGKTWIQQAKLTSTDTTIRFGGAAVAISGDGNTVLVGASRSNANNPDKVFVFVRTGMAWSQQAVFGGPGVTVDPTAVALSGDGNRALIGSSYFNHALIFLRSGTTWAGEATLSPTPTASGFGAGVRLSSDGSTAAIVALGGGGAIYVYTRNGTAWTQQSKFTRNDPTPDYYGFFPDHAQNMILSADGNTIVALDQVRYQGGPSEQVRAYVFARSGTTWTQQAILQGAVQGESGFGDDVAITGNTLFFGDAGYESAIYVFTRSGTNWNPQPNIVAYGVGLPDFADTIVASADGSTLAAHAINPNDGTSEVVFFTFGPPLAVLPSSLPDAVINQPYSVTITPSGGAGGPYTFAFVDTYGVPQGLHLDPNTGVLSGTVTGVSDYGFTVRITDSAGRMAFITYTLNVDNAPPSVAPMPHASGASSGSPPLAKPTVHPTTAPSGGQAPMTQPMRH